MEGLKGFRGIIAITAATLLVACSVTISVQAQAGSGNPCTASQIAGFTPCINFITGSSAGGSSGSSTPTPGCCNSFTSLMSTGMDCACLIVTGNVPLPLPINRALAISISQACNLPLQCKATGVPLPAPGPVLLAPPPPLVPASSPHSPVVPPLVPASSPHSPVVPASSPHSPVVPASSPSSPVAAAAPSPLSPTGSKSLAVGETPAETPAIPAETPAETPATPAETPAGTTASPPGHSVAPKATPGVKPVMTSTSASSPSYIPSPFVLLVFMGIMVFKSY